MKLIQEKQTIAGREITLETGVMAKQANGAVIIKCGDTVMLATATMNKEAKPGQSFFPLTIEYIEKMYAGGKIPGGFFKRETRPGADETLNARLIDRPIRPCFPKYFMNEVQIVITVLSYDESFSPDFMSMIGASAALSVSDIPFAGPIGAAFVCEVDGELKASPSKEEEARATLDIMVAGTKDAILMIEAGGNEVSEDRIIEAIQFAHEVIKETITLQESLQKQSGKEKFVPPAIEEDKDLEAKIKSFIGDKIASNLENSQKNEVEELLSQLQKDVTEEFVTEDSDNAGLVGRYFNEIKKEEIRKTIITKKVRPDGRKCDEVRAIAIETGLLPSTHGSSLFTRGETQSLGVITLGDAKDEQMIDNLQDDAKRSYMFHYNFPPYSVGECGFVTRTGRRELGHGALAGRALQPVLPNKTDFPYTIRIVSEILESNGSSSMASVCSGALCMMDAGVPIKSPVSGIAMGLLMSDDGYVVLSDIQGLEDHYGDMDFKVAGTKDGITALQLDIKISGLSEEILRNALAQAKEGRSHILNEMNKVMDAPRAELSPNAPQIEFIKIDPSKVGLLIGPGGKQIRQIEEDTQATVFVADGDQGDVSISGKSAAIVKAAKDIINALCKDVEQGDVFDGKVVKVAAFGAFIQLVPGKEGLLHISKVADHRVEDITEYIEQGQEIKVAVDRVDQQGKISLIRAKA